MTLSQKRTLAEEDGIEVSDAQSELNKFAKLKVRKLGLEFQLDDFEPEFSLDNDPGEFTSYQPQTEKFQLSESLEDNFDYPEAELTQPPGPIRQVAPILPINLQPVSKSQAQVFVGTQGSSSSTSAVLDLRENKKATTINGSVLYFKYDRLKRIQDTLTKAHDTKPPSLLRSSVYRMMDELEAEQISRSAAAMEQAMMDDGGDDLSIDEILDHSLFTDKYKPKSYIDLMSDEWINQEVLLWIKQWDQCVFGKNPSDSLKEKFKRTTDKLGRPEKKVLLLTGPPGFGKTTMVQVLARQSGYNVYEINARTGSVVLNQIKNAVETKSLFGDRRPNLVIVDEIDGVSGSKDDSSFIRELLNLVNPRGKKKKNVLRRPIICICNDPYVPALRPLRAMAQMYNFRKPANSELIKRLRRICEMEELKTDSRALSMLVEKAEGDIRTCLNTLQMLKAKLIRQHRVETFSKNDKNRKNLTVSVDTIKNASIFKNLYSQYGMKSSIRVCLRKKYLIEASEKCLHMLETTTDYDIILEGCFENYLKMDFRETSANGSNIISVLEFVAFYDLTMANMFKGKFYTPVYLPFVALAFNMYCKHLGIPKRTLITFPKAAIEAKKATKTSMQMITDFSQHADVKTRQWINHKYFSADIVSLLVRIISPHIRPINPQLLKPDEKRILQRLVNVMTTLSLTFLHAKGQDGKSVYNLDPPVDMLMAYKNKSTVKQFATFNYSVRQVIAGEIEKEAIRREAKVVTRNQTAEQKKESMEKRNAEIEGRKVEKKLKEVSTIRPKDFFGRDIIVDPSEVSARQKSKICDAPITFKFHEGFSNAVRRPVLMSDLLST